MNRSEVAKLIDHTLLKPEASEGDVIKLCKEANEHGFASVCINPVYVNLAKKELAQTAVMVCTVVGFPLGANTAAIKALEAEQAVAAGADEIDMVLNIGLLKAGNRQGVLDDITGVVKASQGKTVKVILETGALTDQEKVIACQLAVQAGAHFVKTSTGFGPGGATVADIKLMRQTVGPDIGVKASGGVRTYETLIEMVQAGATRIGTSGGVSIITGAASKNSY